MLACPEAMAGRMQQTVLLSTSGGNSRLSWPVRVPAEVTRTGPTTCQVLAPHVPMSASEVPSMFRLQGQRHTHMRGIT